MHLGWPVPVWVQQLTGGHRIQRNDHDVEPAGFPGGGRVPFERPAEVWLQVELMADTLHVSKASQRSWSFTFERIAEIHSEPKTVRLLSSTTALVETPCFIKLN